MATLIVLMPFVQLTSYSSLRLLLPLSVSAFSPHSLMVMKYSYPPNKINVFCIKSEILVGEFRVTYRSDARWRLIVEPHRAKIDVCLEFECNYIQFIDMDEESEWF
jgi:hypothetical protein